MKKKDRIDQRDVDMVGHIISTESDYDLQYDPKSKRIVASNGEGYELGIVEDSILFEKAEEFIRMPDSKKLASEFEGPIDIDNFFDYLEQLKRLKLGKAWDSFIHPFKRDIGLEWAVSSGLDPYINDGIPMDAVDPDIPEVPCRKCGSVCTTMIDPNGAPSEISGRRIKPVLAVCTSCGSKYPMRVLNDGYEVGLHHVGAQHPFWTYADRDQYVRRHSSKKTFEDELRILLEDRRMGVRVQNRLSKLLGKFKGKRRSPTNPDYVMCLCFANFANAIRSPPMELRSLPGEGLKDVFAVMHLITTEEASGYPTDVNGVLEKIDSFLVSASAYHRYSMPMDYLLNRSMIQNGKDDEILMPFLRDRIILMAENVAEPDCHDARLKSLFCDTFETLCMMNAPVFDDILKRCEELFCGDVFYRGITAVVSFKSGVDHIMRDDFTTGLVRLNNVFDSVRNEQDAGPITGLRAALASILIAAIEGDSEKAILGMQIMSTLEGIVPMDSRTKMEILMLFMTVLDPDKKVVVSRSDDEIRDLAAQLYCNGVLMFT